MGNAYVAVADDFNAVFYNPAGLARLDDWYLEIINPGVTSLQGLLDFLTILHPIVKVKKVLLILSRITPVKVLQQKLYVIPYFVTKNFGLAIGVAWSFNSNSQRCICKLPRWSSCNYSYFYGL